MSSTYGQNLKLSIFGQSHGPAIGMTLDGIPAGLSVDLDALQTFLNRRAPGQNLYSTPRKEEDRPEFLSGLLEGFTCGAPICAVLSNRNTRSGDYANLKDCPRPGHADYTAQIKYSGYQDVSGGGHFSGRLTAPLCVAGGLCKQWLEAKGVQIGAHLASVAGIQDDSLNPCAPDLTSIQKTFPVVNQVAGEKMQQAILKAKQASDSVGGIIECFATGLPVGLGDPMFDGMENRIAQILFGIPAVKGVEFGSGFACANLMGSEHNDPFCMKENQVKTLTNHAGGILGGITNGMPLIVRVAVKPTPSIAKAQQSICLSENRDCSLEISGRHDPCIAPRAVPVVEAAVALAIFDAFLGRTTC